MNDRLERATGEPTILSLPAACDWEQAYRDNVTGVYRFVYARLGNRADAEDLTAQTFVRALPHLRPHAPPDQVRSYLFTTARTALADHWARRYAVQVEDLDGTAARPSETSWSGEDHRNRALEVLRSLPEHYRRVLELRFLRGYSVRETASEMGISVSNAKVMQLRALRRAAALEEQR